MCCVEARPTHERAVAASPVGGSVDRPTVEVGDVAVAERHEVIQRRPHDLEVGGHDHVDRRGPDAPREHDRGHPLPQGAQLGLGHLR